MQHFNVIFQPEGKRVSIHKGATIIEAAGMAGIVLNTACGGREICKKCAVTLGPGEKQVLACQYHIDSDITVTVPSTSVLFEQNILSRGIESQKQIKPDIYKNHLQPGRDARSIFGIAVDIGTTTVVAKLLDMEKGKCLATRASLNPQTRFGDDVISRITYADTPENSAELQKTIIQCINKLILGICEKASINANEVLEMCVVGNTTMNHLFLNLPVRQLGQAPYEAYSVDAHDLPAGDIALAINPEANIHTVENLAGFVGADTVAAAVAVDIASATDKTLLVDIGTNGEIVLATSQGIYAASCAAGPAMEGARISRGSRAVQGAIEAVIMNHSDIDVDVIGQGPARSICGSGLIDAVAVMLDLGVLDETGRFVEKDRLVEKVPSAIIDRLIDENGEPAFILSHKQNLVLTQKDIRETQLAKAAIRTGIKLLQNKVGIADSDLNQVLLAGAFGNYIRRESALRIGLLPDIPVERIVFVGNAASAGAEMILLSTESRKLARELATKIEYVEIAHEKDFTSVFADSLLF